MEGGTGGRASWWRVAAAFTSAASARASSASTRPCPAAPADRPRNPATPAATHTAARRHRNAGATLGALLALLIAYIVARKAVRGHRVLAFLATAPLAIPGIVLGVGLFLAYTRPPLALYGTLWILLIAFVTIELPAAYQQLGSAFHAVHPELEEAGRMLGATRLRTLADITAPLLRSAVIATSSG